jgi:hypothetical protein
MRAIAVPYTSTSAPVKPSAGAAKVEWEAGMAAAGARRARLPAPVRDPDAHLDHDHDREKHQDVAQAARSGGMQVLTVAAGALLSITHVLLARLFGRAVFGSYQAALAILETALRIMALAAIATGCRPAFPRR